MAVTLEQLAEKVDPVFQRLYMHGERIPGDYDEFGWPSEGSSGDETLADLIEDVSGEVSLPLFEALQENEDEYFLVKEGLQPFYDGFVHYIEAPFANSGHFNLWHSFKERILHVQRFFDNEAAEALSEILGDIETFGVQIGQPPVRFLDPGDEKAVVYRARCAVSYDEAETIVTDPHAELGPPPKLLARSGRLNSAGIPAFYGALDRDTAIAEVRPPVGAHVIVGAFRPLRRIQLLDLTAFSKTAQLGSPFDDLDAYIDRYSRWSFLRTFHRLISRPVLPNDEFLEYVPTQAIADFLHHSEGFDGVLFLSPQTSGLPLADDEDENENPTRTTPREAFNVALFGATGIVRQPGASEDTDDPISGRVQALLDLSPEPDPILELIEDSVQPYRINQVRYAHEEDYVARLPKVQRSIEPADF